MTYSHLDFINLETMSTRELKAELREARQTYNDTQTYFEELEREAYAECPFESCLPKVSILITNLNNIENYIKKIEGLLDEEIGEVVLPIKTRVKRRKMLGKLSL